MKIPNNTESAKVRPTLVNKYGTTMFFKNGKHGNSPQDAAIEYVDVNKFASVLLQHCDKLGLRCPLLRGYVTSCTEVLEAVIKSSNGILDECTIKRTFMALLLHQAYDATQEQTDALLRDGYLKLLGNEMDRVLPELASAHAHGWQNVQETEKIAFISRLCEDAVKPEKILYILQEDKGLFWSKKTKKKERYIRRLYGSVEDLRSFYELYKVIPQDKRCLYSINRSSSVPEEHTILHADIEWYSHGNEPCKKAQARLVAFERAVEYSLRVKVGLKGEFRVYHENSSRVDDKKPGIFKNSYHLYYTNVYFENNSETCMRPFVKQVLDLSDPLLTIQEHEQDYDLNEGDPSIVDKGIYTKNRPFRLPGSHKCGSKQRVSFPSFEIF